MSDTLESQGFPVDQLVRQLVLARDYTSLVRLSQTSVNLRNACQSYLDVLVDEHQYTRSADIIKQVHDEIGGTLGGDIKSDLCNLGAHFWYWTRGPGCEKSGEIFDTMRKDAYLDYKRALFAHEKPFFADVDEPCPPEEHLYSWYMLETKTPIAGIPIAESKRTRFTSPEGMDADVAWAESQKL